METSKSNETNDLKKNLNIKKSIIESWKIFAIHTADFYKYLWIHLAIAGIGFALFTGEAGWAYTEYVQSYYSYIDSGVNKDLAQAIFSPTWQVIGGSVIALLAFLVSYYLLQGGIFTQIRFYQSTGSLPISGPFSFWKELKTDAMQVFFIDILAACIFMIASGLVALLAWKTNWWVLTACIPIALYLQIISSCARMLYVVEKKTFKAAIKEAFHLGHQKFGGYFIIFILTYIPLGITSLIAFLPICIFHLSNSADAITRLMGDPSGLPPYLLPLYAVLAILAIFIWGTAYAIQQWPLAFYTHFNKDKDQVQS